jgi:hypothetical protein
LKSSQSDPLSLDNFMAGASKDDPFNVGLEASSVSSPSNDGFGDHVPPSKNKKQQQNVTDDGFGHFSNTWDTSSNPFAGTKTENDNKYSNPRGIAPPPRVNNDNANSHAHHRVISGKNGRVQRMTSTEMRTRTRNSESRRNMVKDALFSSLGDMDEVGKGSGGGGGGGPGLSSFLSESKGRARRRGSIGGESVGEKSTQSAPAGDRSRKTTSRRGRRGGSALPSQSHDDNDVLSTSSNHARRMGKPFRHKPSTAHRRGSSISSAGSSDGGGQKVTLDIAELSKHGQLKVVDGKMQLILDVEALAK